MADDELPAADKKAARSIKRTPWKVDVRNRLVRVREDMEIAIRASGWKITGASPWPRADDQLGAGSGGAITLESQDGSPGTPQMRAAEAVVSATFGYMAKAEATLQQSTQTWQRPWEWLTGGLLMSAYTSLHAAETNRILLLGSDQLAALLPAIRRRAVQYLPANDPRLEALQGLPDPTAPAHQALERVQSKLVQTMAVAHTAAQTQEKAPDVPASAAAGTSSQATAPDPGLVTLTGTLGRDQHIAAMAMDEATHAEDQQQSQVRRFRGVLLGTFLGLLAVVALLIIWGSVHPGYFPLCVHQQTTHGPATVCPTGGRTPDKADMALIMAIGGVGALLAVATNLSDLKPTGVRYSLSVAQGMIKIPFGAITAMLGIIIVSTQSNVGVLATQAGLLSTAAVSGYSQQLFTKFIDKQANSLLTKAGGSG